MHANISKIIITSLLGRARTYGHRNETNDHLCRKRLVSQSENFTKKK